MEEVSEQFCGDKYQRMFPSLSPVLKGFVGFFALCTIAFTGKMVRWNRAFFIDKIIQICLELIFSNGNHLSYYFGYF